MAPPARALRGNEPTFHGRLADIWIVRDLENLLLSVKVMSLVHTVRRHWGPLVLATTIVAVYAAVLWQLVEDWNGNENYSHGFLVLPVAAFLVWRRRATLAALPVAPSAFGAVLVVLSLGVLLVGTAGIEYFLTRISFVGVIAGAILFLFGWAQLRAVSFPLFLLLLAIPLPAILFNQVAFPLQMLATTLGVGILRLLDVPVLREGNVIVLATTTLEVAEACSGIRSLVSLFTMALLFGYLTHDGPVARTLLALSAVPTAILTNALRVAGTGVMADRFGVWTATGPLHTFSGWLVFVASLGLMLVLDWTCVRLAPAFASSRSRHTAMGVP